MSDEADRLIASAYAARREGRLQQALDEYRSAAHFFQLRFAHAIRHAADVLRDMKRDREAIRKYEEALAVYRTLEHRPLDLANTLRGYALAWESLGEIERAREGWREARDLYEKVQVQAGVDEASERLASYQGLLP